MELGNQTASPRSWRISVKKVGQLHAVEEMIPEQLITEA